MLTVLGYVLPPAALALAILNALWLWRLNRDMRRRRAALLEAANLRADRQLEQALDIRDGDITRGRKAAST